MGGRIELSVTLFVPVRSPLPAGVVAICSRNLHPESFLRRESVLRHGPLFSRYSFPPLARFPFLLAVQVRVQLRRRLATRRQLHQLRELTLFAVHFRHRVAHDLALARGEHTTTGEPIH